MNIRVVLKTVEIKEAILEYVLNSSSLVKADEMTVDMVKIVDIGAGEIEAVIHQDEVLG